MRISRIGIALALSYAILSGCDKSPEPDKEFIDGINYYQGNGVSVDYNRALELFNISAEKNNPAAETALGDMYFYGHGVARDYKISKEWYSKAAIQKFPPAQIRMVAFADGFEEKIKILLPLAEQGNSDAQYQLGALYQNAGTTAGTASQQYFDRAIKWFRTAAKKDSYALISLALMYQNGWGVRGDKAAAYALLKTAETAGYRDAANLVLDSLKEKMNPMEIEDGINLEKRMAEGDALEVLDQYLANHQ
ncbi:tetratricopeptide repeat protein [Pseudomonas sp.]|uniref:tetratricopeptide repeat protein n=1 Tax=Pseudomonas sp. TaxID=306 RepID=UPI003D0EA183